jgi:hypothetical protein
MNGLAFGMHLKEFMSQAISKPWYVLSYQLALKRNEEPER